MYKGIKKVDDRGIEMIEMTSILRGGMVSDTDNPCGFTELCSSGRSGMPSSSSSSCTTKHDIFKGLNDGLGICRYYNCGLVAASVAEYFISGVLNKPQANWFPADIDKQVDKFSQKPTLIENVNISTIENYLAQSGKGSHAIITADYSSSHEEGRYLFGLREKDWGHSFNVYYQGDGVFTAIDAYSSRYLELSKNYRKYIEMYRSRNMDCYIWKGGSK